MNALSLALSFSPNPSDAFAPSRKLLWLVSAGRKQKAPPSTKGEQTMKARVASKGRVVLAALGLSLFGASAAVAEEMTLTSTELKEGASIANEQVFKGFGCTGGNISPALSWSGAPSGTKSFAISVYDPDAPTGSGWWHWVVFNLPASTTSLPKGAGDVKKKLVPKGAIQSRTDFGAGGYGGPCPPAGDKPHHYQITVFAVDVDKLPDAKNDAASAALVGFDLHFHTLAKATLTGLYGR
jgi:Raf kinase inhibitor-like YbhB/YbcL family protein